MSKLLKFLKPFTFMIMLIIGLLFTQAICELALPDYMSNIVNKGIQQGGIEENVPKIIRKSEFDKILLFIDDTKEESIINSYQLLSKDNLSEKEYKDYIKEYPLLETEALYKIKVDDTKDIDTIMGKAMLAVYGIESGTVSGLDEMQIPAGVDPFVLISHMPKEQLDIILGEMDKKLSAMPESMVSQSASVYIKAEYGVIGIDTSNIQKNYIITAGLKMVGIAFLAMITTVVVGFLASRVASGFGRNIRLGLFKKVESFSNVEFEKFGSASLITRTTNDIQQVQQMMIMLLRVVFFAPILGIGGFLKVIQTDMSMGWIIGLAISAIFVVIIGLFIFAVPRFKMVQKLIDKLNLVVRESLTGIFVIRAFNTEKHEESKFAQANRNLTKTHLFIGRTMSIMFPLMMLIMNAITILIVWVGAHQVDNGAIQVGDMMAFIQYTMQIIMSFLMISMTSFMLPRASVAASRIGEVLKVNPVIVDPEMPKNLGKKVKGTVKFDNVSFKYPDADGHVIKNISFVAEPGQTTAFIGSTGSGKSTIVNLIPRFYDVTEGSIQIDGIDIREVTQNDLRDKIGYVPQKGILFSGTIESNLKYGKEKATKNDLVEAATIAQAIDFIEAKAEKFDTDIAQGGTNVSGGQKQRLSIARALVKKPQIYIFDDTFSALDYKTDAALRKALNDKTKESTVLIVAQRISTIMNADQIIVLEKGEIVGKGTHKQLMKSCKVYQEIALSQLSKEELA